MPQPRTAPPSPLPSPLPIIFVAIVAGSIMLHAFYVDYTRHSNKEKNKQAFLEAHKSPMKRVAVWHNMIWYIINDTTISSEENGQGTIVNLPVIMRTRTSYDKIDTNRVEIKFVPDNALPPH